MKKFSISEVKTATLSTLNSLIENETKLSRRDLNQINSTHQKAFFFSPDGKLRELNLKTDLALPAKIESNQNYKLTSGTITFTKAIRNTKGEKVNVTYFGQILFTRLQYDGLWFRVKITHAQEEGGKKETYEHTAWRQIALIETFKKGAKKELPAKKEAKAQATKA